MNIRAGLQDVKDVVDQLTANGKKPGPVAVRAALGKGSMTTVVQHLRSLKEADLKKQDSPQALEKFRELWTFAVETGRSQLQSQVNDLTEAMESISNENMRYDGEIIALRQRLENAERVKGDTEAKLSKVREDLDVSRTLVTQQSSKLLETFEQHNRELANVLKCLDEERLKVSELTCKLVQVQTLLDERSKTISNESLNDHPTDTRFNRQDNDLRAPNTNSDQ